MENSSIDKKDEINFKELITQYIHYWYLFVISVVMCLGLGFVYLKITTPVYMATASIMVKEEEGSGISSMLMKGSSFGGMFGGSSNVEDEALIAQSHTIIKNAVSNLGLTISYKYDGLLRDFNYYNNAPIKVNVPTSVIDTLSVGINIELDIKKDGSVASKAKLGRKVLDKVSAKTLPITLKTDYGNYEIQKTDFYTPKTEGDFKIMVLGSDIAAEEFQKQLTIETVNKRVNMITLSHADVNVERAKDLLNKIIEEYNNDCIRDKNVVAKNTANFIEKRLLILGEELDIVEKDIELYKSSNNLTDIEAEARMLITKGADFRERVLEIETNAEIITLIEEYVKSPANKYELIPSNISVSENGVSDAIREYNLAILERLKLTRTTSDSNPIILTINSQLDAMRSNVLRSIQSAKKSIDIARKDFKKQEDEFTARMKGIPEQEREFLNIKRQQVIKEEILIFLLQKKEENELTLSITAPKAKIVDAAYRISKPLSPNKQVIIIVSFLLGLILPVIGLYLRGFFNVRFGTKNELQQLTNVPILGEICTNKTNDVLVVKEGDTSAIVELFRLVRTNLQFILNRKDDKVVLVTSSVSGEGKSFFSSNLSMSLALLNKKVLLVGLDIRNPRLMDYLHLPANAKGITNYLSTPTLKIEDIIIRSHKHSSLDIITAGPVPPNPGELLLGDRLDELFIELRKQYDYIIIDSAPIGMVSDTLSLMRIVDATLYVCRAHYTQKDHIKYFNSVVVNNQIKRPALILNGTTTKQGYGYGYGQNVKKK